MNLYGFTLNCSMSARIKISKRWPYWNGHPPNRSSLPQSLRTKWFRTNTFWFGRMLKCKFMSSDGAIEGPFLMSTRNLQKSKSISIYLHFSILIFPYLMPYQSWWRISPEIRIIRPWWSPPESEPKNGIGCITHAIKIKS